MIKMKLDKFFIFIMITAILVAGAIGATAAYTGTGFSHSKSVSDYDSLSLMTYYPNTVIPIANLKRAEYVPKYLMETP